MEKIKHDSILESFSILNFNEQNLNKKKCLNIKCFIFLLIGIIICLFTATIILLILYLKLSKNQKNSLENCEAKVNKLEILSKNLQNKISYLKKENSELTNSNNYKTKYQNLETKFNETENSQNTISTSKDDNLEWTTDSNNYKTKKENLEGKVNETEIILQNLQNTISTLKNENSQCNNNLNNYKTKYQNLETEYTKLNTNYNNLISKNNNCENNYNTCQNNYKTTQNRYDTCLYDHNSCKNKIKNECTVYYQSITSEMENKIIQFIQNCYNMYSDNEDRSKCVSNRMTNTYSKNKWSCVVGIYGYYRLYIYQYVVYRYDYNNLVWVVYVGEY